MTEFKFGEWSVDCESEGTRYGFRHLATLYKNWERIGKTKICYYNRTWESYEFESVINKLMSLYPEFKEAVELNEIENKI